MVCISICECDYDMEQIEEFWSDWRYGRILGVAIEIDERDEYCTLLAANNLNGNLLVLRQSENGDDIFLCNYNHCAGYMITTY